jgi:hypothetical protein
MFRTASLQRRNEASRVNHQSRATPPVRTRPQATFIPRIIAPAFTAGASPCNDFIKSSFPRLLRADILEERQSVGVATTIEFCTALNSRSTSERRNEFREPKLGDFRRRKNRRAADG